jgi:hypothetical protein
VRTLCLLALIFSTTALAGVMDAGTSTDAGTIDAGTDDDAGPVDGGGCGSVTFEGECLGPTVVVYCDMDQIVEIDCTEIDPAAICLEINPTYGYDCAQPAGEACEFDFGGGFEAVFCAGTDPGCVADAEGSSCEENVGPCVETDIDSCDGDRLVLDCTEGQPYLLDCAGYLGTCDTDHCVVPVPAFCDDVVLVCEPGAQCGALGLCEPIPAPDSGVRDTGSTPGPDASADAGTGGMEEEDGGCGCSAGREGGGHALLTIGLLWWITRRRGR